jgi:photosystem II stability/assembly factor-like uncharacterized protein
VKLLLGAAIGAAALVAAFGASAGSSAPAGFEPESFSAVSARDFWLLGTVPCRSARGPAVMRTSTGGRSFVRVTAPPLRIEESAGLVEGELRFADARDGFAFGWRAPLYATHNGGKTWHRLALRSVFAFATAGGTAYAVTGRCSQDGSCRDVRFERSPVSRDAWRSTPMPFARAVPNFDLAARGSNVWLFGGSSTGKYRLEDVLARSADGGRTFLTGSAPCYADLAAELEPSPDGTLWAFCPTGMMGGAWRSPDGGRTFKSLPIPGCCINGAQLAPASADAAVLAPNVSGRPPLLRTTDEGKTWQRARTPGHSIDWLAIDFGDRRDGWALVQPRPTGPAQVWRTTDAGASWQVVPIR